METDASGYVMGVVLMHGGRLVCYHYEVFHWGFLNHPTYDKELFSLVHDEKKWKHYMMQKKIVIYIDH